MVKYSFSRNGVDWGSEHFNSETLYMYNMYILGISFNRFEFGLLQNVSTYPIEVLKLV